MSVTFNPPATGTNRAAIVISTPTVSKWRGSMRVRTGLVVLTALLLSACLRAETQDTSLQSRFGLSVDVTQGMRRYGYSKEADRISYEFLSMLAEDFRREGTIHEKYDVVKRSSGTNVVAGHTVNVVRFGWTNGVFLELLHILPNQMVERLDAELATSASAVGEAPKH